MGYKGFHRQYLLLYNLLQYYIYTYSIAIDLETRSPLFIPRHHHSINPNPLYSVFDFFHFKQPHFYYITM